MQLIPASSLKVKVAFPSVTVDASLGPSITTLADDTSPKRALSEASDSTSSNSSESSYSLSSMSLTSQVDMLTPGPKMTRLSLLIPRLL